MNIKICVAASLFALSSSAAFAGDMYVLGSIGQSKIETWNYSGSGVSTDTTDTSYKLQLGYQVNKYFALEGGYFNLGKARARTVGATSTDDVSVKADGVNVTALGILPLDGGFSLFGKLGAFHSSSKGNDVYTSSGTTQTYSQTGHRNGIIYGVGAGYEITKSIAIRAEYEVYDKVGGDSSFGTSKVNVASVGLAYKF